MTTIKTWKIDSIECKKQEQGFEDVVYVVHWRLNGSNGSHHTSVYGSQSLSFDPTDPDYEFVPYEELNEETVLGWVKSAIGEEKVFDLEFNIDNQIETLINPLTETKPLPWNTL